MIDVFLVPQSEFKRVTAAPIEKHHKLKMISDLCRVNALSMVKRAGSGHLGSSLSAMDIVVKLYYDLLNVSALGVGNPNRDIYFSSKGHDVPGFYAVLYSLGILDKAQIMRLRRFGGLDGHPDIQTPGVEVNSGSLGMGISKAKGIAWAKSFQGLGGRVFVMTGDGELQEGQNYEALQSAVQLGITNLTVIVDHNKVQSDKPVAEIVDLRDLPLKLQAFGWHVERCNGNDQLELEKAFASTERVTDRPKIIVADTLKGCGVSFMEHPRALQEGKGCYPYHSGAPSDEKYFEAYGELVDRLNTMLDQHGLGQLTLEKVGPEITLPAHYSLLGEPISPGAPVPNKVSKAISEFVAEAYGEALLELGREHPNLVVLDADLAADCRVRAFENTYPERFIQSGIAEQDMVSTAGGMAHHGIVPVVNSFASFLTSRANEQIYNNASEKSKIIYVNHYAGLIPAGPGKSHQSIRDISLMGALPNCLIVQPCNGQETRSLLKYCVEQDGESCLIRLIIGPSPRTIELPPNYKCELGKGGILREGEKVALMSYGPVMMHETLVAAETLAAKGRKIKVINMPWLNRVDLDWLASALTGIKTVFVIEDHAPVGGLGDSLLRSVNGLPQFSQIRWKIFGVEGYPACGTPPEVLRHHGLDGSSLADQVMISEKH